MHMPAFMEKCAQQRGKLQKIQFVSSVESLRSLHDIALKRGDWLLCQLIALGPRRNLQNLAKCLRYAGRYLGKIHQHRQGIGLHLSTAITDSFLRALLHAWLKPVSGVRSGLWWPLRRTDLIPPGLRPAAGPELVWSRPACAGRALSAQACLS